MPKTTMKITDTADLRNFLLDQMIGVSDGSVDQDQARSICNRSQQVHHTITAEIKRHRALHDTQSESMPPVDFKK